jgi:DNA-binding transcriptional MerR regulator
LPSASDGYRRFSSPDLLVRADITYLRQDFSLSQKVADAAPWPEMQRFDYLVRSRTLTEQQAAAYQAEFAKITTPSPYRQAALAALRHLTDLDAGVTAAAWREVLEGRK